MTNARRATRILLGNGSMAVEGQQLKRYKTEVSPWIFWPRRPMMLEKVLKEEGVLSYSDRRCDSVFIGNYENGTQQKYRQTAHDWPSVD